MKLLKDTITIEELESKLKIIKSRFLDILWNEIKSSTPRHDWLEELDERLDGMVQTSGRNAYPNI